MTILTKINSKILYGVASYLRMLKRAGGSLNQIFKLTTRAVSETAIRKYNIIR